MGQQIDAQKRVLQGTFVQRRLSGESESERFLFWRTGSIMTANRVFRVLKHLLIALVIATIIGCGGSETENMLDATTLLERYERDRRRHDPLHFSEVDLGEFMVTQRREPSIFYIRFHLYAVVPDSFVGQFDQLRQTHGERIRAKVRQVTMACDIDHLNDPSLGWLKSELISSINEVTQSPIVRDVVFGDFSFERA